MKRKVISYEVQQEILKKYLDGWSMTDLTEIYKISLDGIRSVLKTTMDTKSPCQARKQLWADNKFVPVHLKDRISKSGKKSPFQRKKRFFKNIPVVIELMNDRVITHADIGRKLRVSREYVGQVAEALAHYGVDVSRENGARGRVAQRGTIA
jgi:biotin operon repressor